MSTQDIADYIKKNLKKGYTLDSLRYSLISQGYSKISVENAIDLANKQMAKEIPSIKERPEIIYKVITEAEETKSLGNNPHKIIDSTTKKGFFNKLFS
jgi:hypothetical protein